MPTTPHADDDESFTTGDRRLEDLDERDLENLRILGFLIDLINLIDDLEEHDKYARRLLEALYGPALASF